MPLNGRTQFMDPLWILLFGIVVVVGGILVLRLHAFLALVLGALLVSALTTPEHLERYAREKQLTEAESKSLLGQSVGARVAQAFGNTCGKIGILIALAAVIGKALLESGAADRIVRSALRLLGEKRAPVAFLGSGFILGIPVFFDTVFYLMIPLGKALAFRTKRNYGLYLMTIIAGGTMAHSLVPPTPGPLFVAGELKVDVGHMILGGLVVGFFTVTTGLIYAWWANRRWEIPLRDSEQAPLRELESATARSDAELPSLSASLLPIVLPVLLITSGTVLKMLGDMTAFGGMRDLIAGAAVLAQDVGNPYVALAIGAALALWMMARKPGMNRESMAASVQAALASGGLIILITAAGGAFGGVLQQCGIGWRIRELAEVWNIGVLPLAFLVTALVRTAQGSATVAMITAVGIVSGFAMPGVLGFHPVYVALAIGCGSKPFPWMNDSGFWVICKMSGMTVPETFRSFSYMLTLMGLVGLAVVMILARLFPLV